MKDDKIGRTCSRNEIENPQQKRTFADVGLDGTVIFNIFKKSSVKFWTA
jgi:hypothetical protein